MRWLLACPSPLSPVPPPLEACIKGPRPWVMSSVLLRLCMYVCGRGATSECVSILAINKGREVREGGRSEDRDQMSILSSQDSMKNHKSNKINVFFVVLRATLLSLVLVSVFSLLLLIFHPPSSRPSLPQPLLPQTQTAPM